MWTTPCKTISISKTILDKYAFLNYSSDNKISNLFDIFIASVAYKIILITSILNYSVYFANMVTIADFQ